jgi:hypothetical protein
VIPAPLRWLAAASAAQLGLLLTAGSAASAGEPLVLKFAFGGDLNDGTLTHVAPTAAYSAERGYGFEPGAAVQLLEPEGVTSATPFFFSVKVPEGNYRVTVTLGDRNGASATTIRAESRRLMVERAATATGELYDPHVHRQHPHRPPAGTAAQRPGRGTGGPQRARARVFDVGRKTHP